MASVRNYFGITFILLAFLFFVSPAWAQDSGCPNPRVVLTESGTGNKTTPPFNTRGERFRITSEVTAQSSNPFLSIFVDDAQGNPVASTSQTQAGKQVSFVNEGPGSYTLEIFQINAQYKITVEDCTTTTRKKKGGNGRQEQRKDRRESFFRQPQDSQEEQYLDAEQDLDSSEATNGEDTSGNDLNDTQDGDGNVSATSGNGQAEASTPGPVARSGDPDDLQPLTSIPDDVENEIPTSGPLPNTGGAPLWVYAIPSLGVLLLALSLLRRMR